MNTYLVLLFVSLCLQLTVSVKNYYVVTKHKVNWFVAFQNCLTDGLQLATINSDQEHKDLEKAIQNADKNQDNKFAWISANDLGSEGKFIWMSTGKPMVNAKFYPQRPSNNHVQNCVHTWPIAGDSIQFAHSECEAEKYYVCEDRVIQTVPTKKYHIMKINKVNWHVAFQDCLSRGYQLATITSQDDQDNIKKMMNDSNNKNWLWTSGSDLGIEGQYIWMSTSKPFTYNNWATKQPDNVNRKKHCMYITSVGSQIEWYNLDCTEKLFYLCEEIPIKQDVCQL